MACSPELVAPPRKNTAPAAAANMRFEEPLDRGEDREVVVAGAGHDVEACVDAVFAPVGAQRVDTFHAVGPRGHGPALVVRYELGCVGVVLADDQLHGKAVQSCRVGVGPESLMTSQGEAKSADGRFATGCVSVAEG